MWDANMVLSYLITLSPAHKLALRDLTLKTCMLIALLSAQRQQTIHMLQIGNMEKHASYFVFYVDELIKQSRPGNVGTKIELQAYAVDKILCCCMYLQRYLQVTQSLWVHFHT